MTNITHYFGKSVDVTDIRIGGTSNAGGRNKFSNEQDLEMIVDTGIEPLVQKMMLQKSSINKEGLKSWLEQSKIGIDTELYAPLFAFTNVYQQDVGFKISPANQREKSYANSSPLLSDLLSEGLAACAEIATLAQVYLQEAGIESSYFSGEVAWDRKDEFAEPHSFIHIKHNGEEYIFDPRNPIAQSNDGNITFLPRIYHVHDFKEKIGRDQKTLVEAKIIYNESKAWYGTGDGTNLTDNVFIYTF